MTLPPPDVSPKLLELERGLGRIEELVVEPPFVADAPSGLPPPLREQSSPSLLEGP